MRVQPNPLVQLPPVWVRAGHVGQCISPAPNRSWPRAPGEAVNEQLRRHANCAADPDRWQAPCADPVIGRAAGDAEFVGDLGDCQ